MTPQGDNLKAGIFVLVGIVLTLVVVFTLADFRGLVEQKQRIKLSYTLSDGLRGLREGAAVTLGNTPVGVVVDIHDHVETATNRVMGKVVTAEIPKRYRINDDAIFELVVPPLGAGTTLNIRSVGSGAQYDPSKTIEGGLSPNMLAQQLVSQMGIRDKQRQHIADIIDNVRALSQSLRQDLPQITAKVKNLLGDLDPILNDARQAVANFKDTSIELKSVMHDVRGRSGPWFDRMDSITESADGTMTRLDDLLRDKDPALRQMVDNARDITQHLRQKTLAQVDEALTKATTAIDHLKVAAKQSKELIVGQRPVLERAIANAQLTTDQLKLAAIEVRRSPWRLLYKPGDKELETDNLYDAARSYALAAGALDTAATSLRAVADDQDESGERVTRMLDHLESLFVKYEEAEDTFWKALKGRQ